MIGLLTLQILFGTRYLIQEVVHGIGSQKFGDLQVILLLVVVKWKFELRDKLVVQELSSKSY